MGSASSIVLRECAKPADGSDLQENDVDGAVFEVQRLRELMGLIEARYSLGPFALTYLSCAKRVISLTTSGTEYQVTGPPHLAQVCIATGLSGCGMLSPKYPVTLPNSMREAAGIHTDATTFAFAFPLAHIDRISEEGASALDPEEPSISFLCFGGFVYFSADNEVLHVNAISMGNDLHFDGPFSLPLPCISSLIQQDRLGPVTIYNLLLAGAVEFAFLGPDEAIAGSASSCMLPVDIPHGAFVYRFSNPNDNRYFPVRSLPRAQNAPRIGGTLFPIAASKTSAAAAATAATTSTSTGEDDVLEEEGDGEGEREPSTTTFTAALAAESGAKASESIVVEDASLVDGLEKLAALFERGLLSADEFANAKSGLFNKFA